MDPGVPGRVDVLDADPSDFQPNLRALQYLEAAAHLLDEGKVVNLPNLGAELGITKQGVWKYQRENPGLMAWVSRELMRHNDEYLGAVMRRLAHLAMKGSPEHAKLFLMARGELREKHEHDVRHSLLDLLAPAAGK